VSSLLNVSVRRLTSQDNRLDFKSGNLELDYYFQRFAGQNQFRHYLGTSYVAMLKKQVTGFITISSGELTSESASRSLQKKLPAYPIPILRISRLAVDKRFQNQGIGKLLLRSMFELAVNIREQIGCVGIVIDAKQESISFYTKLGFITLEATKGMLRTPTDTTPLFLNLNLVTRAKQ